MDPTSLTVAHLWQLLLIIAAGAGTIFYITGHYAKARHEELEELVSTRGNRIEDLEKKVDYQGQEIHELKGMVQAIQAMKATEIADEVVARLQGRIALPD